MACYRTAFEKELKQRVLQKSSSHLSEEAVLLKSFRYFDLNNKGTVNQQEFIKCIEKIGIPIFNKQDFVDLFSYYDKEGKGQLDYKEFISMVYGNATATTRKDSPKKASGNKRANDYFQSHTQQDFVVRLQQKLREKGIRGMLGVARDFKIVDENSSKTVDINEFDQVLRKNQINVNEEEIQEIFDYFDRRRQNELNYEEFLLSIRGPTQQTRRKMIKNTFKLLDIENRGVLRVQNILAFFNPKMHPDVRTGRRNDEDVLKELTNTLQDYCTYRGIKNESLTEQEFEDYFTFFSSCISPDEYFELFINSVWNRNAILDNKSQQKSQQNANSQNKPPQSVSNQSKQDCQDQKSIKSNKSALHDFNQQRPATNQVQQLDPHQILEKIRKKLSNRGIRGFIGIQRQFRIMDDNYDRAVNQSEFRKAMNDYKMNLSDSECELLFELLDTEQRGSVDIDDLIHSFQGDIGSFRRNLIEQAYNQLDKYGNQQVTISDIKNSFNCKCHPDVRTAKRTEDEILGEFLETFELHHNLRVGMKESIVSKEEFHEYYQNVSCTIENDQYFEMMMVNAYKLYQNNQQLYQQYAPPNYKPQYQNQEYRSKTTQNAPFGTSNTPMDYSTSLRPTSKQQQQKPQANEYPAGSPSWPGYNWQVQQQQNSEVGSKVGSQRQNGQEVFNQLKSKVLNRGIRGFLSLNKMYRVIDDEGNRMINFQDFVRVCKELRTGIPEQEFIQVFKLFDQNGEGCIDFDEFLRSIKGNMNQFRKNLVMSAFAKLDKNKQAVVDLDDILGIYDVSKHPEVLNGRKTEEEVLGDFLDTFEKHHLQWFGNNDKSKQVDIDEFIEYYNIVSATIEDDKQYEAIIRSGWRI